MPFPLFSRILGSIWLTGCPNSHLFVVIARPDESNLVDVEKCFRKYSEMRVEGASKARARGISMVVGKGHRVQSQEPVIVVTRWTTLI